jgi:hypothetical protein
MQGVIITGWSRYSTNMTQVAPIDGSLDSLALAAWILRTGSVPRRQHATCERWLRLAGEWQRHVTGREVLSAITRQRAAGWEHVRILRQYAVCAADDRRRFPSAHADRHLRYLADAVEQLDQLKPVFLKAFDGLTDEIWLTRFLRERICPLKDELADLRIRMGEQPT